MSPDRRLAAIMFTDVVGYTKLMGSDEARAFRLLKRNRTIQKPLIEKYGGEWLKEMADGILASFSSSSDAVKCAGEIQSAAIEAGIPLRIGIHQGEVVFEGGDVLGDGVNVASRLEDLAEEGKIYISETVYKDIKNKVDIRPDYIGEKKLKNVDEPVKVYCVTVDPTARKEKSIESTTENQDSMLEDVPGTVKMRRSFYIIAGLTVLLALIMVWYFKSSSDTQDLDAKNRVVISADKSIAVLPFVNLSNDPEQEYFSDGMMDEILMHLFKIGELKVTSRTSVMQYKGTTKTVNEIANDLGVSHILEGSVSRAGNRVKITVQLIDAIHDLHLWAESYERELQDVFSIQSDVAQQVAGALKAEISPEVMESIESVPTSNMDAYTLFLQALFLYRQYTDEGNRKAIEFADQVLQMDPGYADAYALMGLLKGSGATWQSSEGGMDPKEAAEVSKMYYLKALEIDADNIWAHSFLAFVYLWYEWDFQKAEEEFNLLKTLRPNYSWTDYLIATGRYEEALQGALTAVETDPLANFTIADKILSYYFAGHPAEAIENINHANESGIKDPYVDIATARVYLYLGKYIETIEVVEKFLIEYEGLRTPRALAILAIAYFQTGQVEKASEFLQEIESKSAINAGGSPAFYAAMVYAQMGDPDMAFNWLGKAYEAHEVEMYWLKVEPPFQPIHQDTRWKEMLSNVGFPGS